MTQIWISWAFAVTGFVTCLHRLEWKLKPNLFCTHWCNVVMPDCHYCNMMLFCNCYEGVKAQTEVHSHLTWQCSCLWCSLISFLLLGPPVCSASALSQCVLCVCMRHSSLTSCLRKWRLARFKASSERLLEMLDNAPVSKWCKACSVWGKITVGTLGLDNESMVSLFCIAWHV